MCRPGRYFVPGGSGVVGLSSGVCGGLRGAGMTAPFAKPASTLTAPLLPPGWGQDTNGRAVSLRAAHRAPFQTHRLELSDLAMAAGKEAGHRVTGMWPDKPKGFYFQKIKGQVDNREPLAVTTTDSSANS